MFIKPNETGVLAKILPFISLYITFQGDIQGPAKSRPPARF